MKITAAIQLGVAKKIIKQAWKALQLVDANHPIEKLFNKYGYGRTKRKYRIILKLDGSPSITQSVVIPKPIRHFLDVASKSWSAAKGKPVKLVFENYIMGTLVNELDPKTPLDKRGPTYFAKLLALNRKLIGNAQYEELRQLYDGDKQRSPSARRAIGQKYVVVISRHPYDILGYSSGRDWHASSCLSIDGVNFEYVYEEMKKSLAAFLVPAEDFVMARIDRKIRQYPRIHDVRYTKVVDDEVFEGWRSNVMDDRPAGTVDNPFITSLPAFDILSRPIARIAIKPYFDKDDNMILYPGREYGEAPSEFKRRLSKFVWLHNRKQPNNDYDLAPGLYEDTDQPHKVYFAKSINGLTTRRLLDLAASPVTDPKLIESFWKSINHDSEDGRDLALAILRNNNLPRSVVVDAFNKDISEYMYNIVVYQSSKVGPAFLKYMLKKPDVAFTILLQSPNQFTASMAQYLTKEHIDHLLTSTNLSRVQLYAILPYHSDTLGELLDTKHKLSSVTTDSSVLLSDMLPGKKANIIRNMNDPKYYDQVVEIFNEDPVLLEAFRLSVQIKFSTSPTVLRQAASAGPSVLDWSQLPRQLVETILAFGREREIVINAAQIPTLLSLNLLKEEEPVHVWSVTATIQQYPQVAPYLVYETNTLRDVPLSDIAEYCRIAHDSNIEIFKPLINLYMSRITDIDSLSDLITISKYVPISYRYISGKLDYKTLLQAIDDGLQVIVLSDDSILDLMPDLSAPAIVTRGMVKELTTASLFSTNKLHFYDLLLYSIELCERNEFRQEYATKLCERTYYGGISNSVIHMRGYNILLSYIEKEHLKGTKTARLVAILPRADRSFNLPLYTTPIPSPFFHYVHYTHIDRKLTDDDEFTVVGPNDPSEVPEEDKIKLWRYVTDKEYKPKYPPTSLPSCVSSDIYYDWFDCVTGRALRLEPGKPTPYLVVSVEAARSWPDYYKERVIKNYERGLLKLPLEVLMCLQINEPITVNEVYSLLQVNHIKAAEIAKHNFPVLMDWIANNPEQYKASVNRGKFYRLSIPSDNSDLYYQLLLTVIKSWTLDNYVKNRVYNLVADGPELSEYQVDSLIHATEKLDAHVHVIVMLITAMGLVQQREKVYQLLLKKCLKYGRQYTKVIPSLSVFCIAFGVKKGTQYRATLLDAVKQAA